MAKPVQPTLLDPLANLNNLPVRPVQQTQATPSLNTKSWLEQNSYANLQAERQAALARDREMAADLTAQTAAAKKAANVDNVAIPYQNPGEASRNDDNTPFTRSKAEQLANSTYNVFVNAQPNVLDQYASYTYCLTWYMLTPEQYASFAKTSRPDTQSWMLLMQSGGAPAAVATASSGGRSPYFSLDYYMDNLVLDHLFPGKGASAVHNVGKISFTVVEPSGISLIRNLRQAGVDMIKGGSNQGDGNLYTTVIAPETLHYCITIDFYGYDAEGNLVKAGKRGNGANNGFAGSSNPAAIIRKYITFNISKITFKLTSKGSIEYSVECSPITTQVNASSNLGSIPFAFALSGETLDQLLNGNPLSDSTPSPTDGRIDHPEPAQQATPTKYDKPANATNAYVEDTGVDFGHLSG